MRTGLVFGKFMPLHKGHLALVDFALANCDHLNVVLCYCANEPISSAIRKQWLDDIFGSDRRVTIVSFEYDETVLPNTSTSSKEVSEKWAFVFRSLVPDTTVVFTSEPYGDYVAEFLNIEHYSFDPERTKVGVSGTLLRQHPFRYWNFLPPPVQTYFVKKICIVGTESTGKSTLTERLAKYFKTVFVPEMARDIVDVTEHCTEEDLVKISIIHANAIIRKLPDANKFLFVDTDVNITASYSEFLFNKPFEPDRWIKDANSFDLHLFLEADCDFVQDGTRLPADERIRLSNHHKSHFVSNKISFESIGGNWEDRFNVSRKIIESRFGHLS